MADFVLAKRAEVGITQRELARRMGFDVKTVRAIEAGRSVAKTTVAALDGAFDLPVGTARRALETGTAEEPATPPPPPTRDEIRERLDSFIARLERLRTEIVEVFEEGDELRELLGDGIDSESRKRWSA
ncbi:helix-turn-helix domain-containing protein [Prauserella flavalba]|uniref:helix-turn-helix domain-containing protein n=1 Tax=Prauserella flavalba TaxID=1477506 RepID=UPI0036EE5817